MAQIEAFHLFFTVEDIYEVRLVQTFSILANDLGDLEWNYN